MPILNVWAEIVAQPPASSVRKQKIEGGGADLVRIEIMAGTVSSRHAHAHEQFVQVIAGAGPLETADGRCMFSAGSVFHFQPTPGTRRRSTRTRSSSRRTSRQLSG